MPPLIRPRASGGGGPLELAQRANRGGGGAGRGASFSLQKILFAGRNERPKMSGYHRNSCGALSPAPPPPPFGRSPSPAIAGADGARRFAGTIKPMVKRVLTSPNLCYGGRQCGGRPRC